MGRKFPGTFDKYVASIIDHLQKLPGSDLKDLEGDLEHVGLTGRVRARSIDAASLELLVGRLARGGAVTDLVNIADTGFGIRQALPVLLALRFAEPNSLVYLEEPELHLHPKAQSRLAGPLAEAAKRGVRVVVETHSSLLLRGVQTLVAKGELAPELVKLHWFQRNAYGMTEVRSADLDRNGAFGEAWPEDFDEITLSSESEYLDAVEAHNAKR